MATLARAHALDAFRVLLEIAMDKNENPNARASAANSILDRAYGKPVQGIALESLDDERQNPIETYEKIVDAETGAKVYMALMDENSPI